MARFLLAGGKCRQTDRAYSVGKATLPLGARRGQRIRGQKKAKLGRIGGALGSKEGVFTDARGDTQEKEEGRGEF